jgi:hypothetical protein
MVSTAFDEINGATLLYSRLIIWALLLCTLASGALADSTREDVMLMSAPSARSEGVASVPKGAEISIQARKGLWAEGCYQEVCGWLRVTSISRDGANKSASTTSLAALKSGREGAGNAVSSTGVRGLDAESIAVDQPDYAALAELKTRRVTGTESADFAADLSLETRTFALLSAPVPQVERDGAAVSGQEDPAPLQEDTRGSKKKRRASDDDW